MAIFGKPCLSHEGRPRLVCPVAITVICLIRLKEVVLPFPALFALESSKPGQGHRPSWLGRIARKQEFAVTESALRREMLLATLVAAVDLSRRERPGRLRLCRPAR